jgi:hypothetical protein
MSAAVAAPASFDTGAQVAYSSSVATHGLAPDGPQSSSTSTSSAQTGASTPATGAPAAQAQAPTQVQTPTQPADQEKKTPSSEDKKLLLQNTPGASGNRIQYAKPGGVQPNTPPPDFGQQPKRILGLMPNYRAVSADVHPPPPSVKEKFQVATLNSFDYSAFIFAGIDAEFPYVSKSYPTLGNGWVGYGRYYWRSFTDKAVGNYMTDFLVPTMTHEDSRYFTLGKGRKLYRAYYAISRLFITPNDEGKNTLNLSEIVGKGAQAGIGNLYYPSSEITWTKTGQRWLMQGARDGLTNVFREFWPDISTHVLHMKPQGQ